MGAETSFQLAVFFENCWLFGLMFRTSSNATHQFGGYLRKLLAN
jgi:hypothetical protein